jgi:hypothetical protein
MTVVRGVFIRFMTLYAALFSGFGFASPFLPAFLAERGLGPEELGLVLGAATALRLMCGPVAGRVRIAFRPIERNFPFAPFWPQLPRSCTWQPMSFGQ